MARIRDMNWLDLCQAAAIEKDPKKLMALLAELIKKLDDRDQKAGVGGANEEDRADSSFPLAVRHCDDTSCGSGF